VPGHWEGDLLSGPNSSYIAALVERHIRYVMLAKVAGKDTQTVVSALIRQAKKLPKELYKSLTWDRGKKLTDHRRFTLATLTETARELPVALLGARGCRQCGKMAQLGRPRRNSMIAALISAGRSCWVQCPQPGSIWMSFSRGTTCFMLAICSAAPGNATTKS